MRVSERWKRGLLASLVLLTLCGCAANREHGELLAGLLNTSTAEQGIAIDPVCRMRVQPSKAAGRLSHEGVDYWFCSLDCASEFAHDPAAFITA